MTQFLLSHCCVSPIICFSSAVKFLRVYSEFWKHTLLYFMCSYNYREIKYISLDVLVDWLEVSNSLNIKLRFQKMYFVRAVKFYQSSKYFSGVKKTSQKIKKSVNISTRKYSEQKYSFVIFTNIKNFFQKEAVFFTHNVLLVLFGLPFNAHFNVVFV